MEPKPRSLILGIDPGQSGALALIDPGSAPYSQPTLFASYAMPTIATKSRVHSKKDRVRVDPIGLADLIGRIHKWVNFAVVEEVGARPNQGMVSTFVFGVSFGNVLQAMADYMLPLHKVRPEVWKMIMGVTKDKATSLAMAKKIFGDESAALHFPRKGDDGVAEAALIAKFGIRFMNQTTKPDLTSLTKGDFAKEILG